MCLLSTVYTMFFGRCSKTYGAIWWQGEVATQRHCPPLARPRGEERASLQRIQKHQDALLQLRRQAAQAPTGWTRMGHGTKSRAFSRSGKLAERSNRDEEYALKENTVIVSRPLFASLAQSIRRRGARTTLTETLRMPMPLC